MSFIMTRGGWRGIQQAWNSLWPIHPLSPQSTCPGLDSYIVVVLCFKGRRVSERGLVFESSEGRRMPISIHSVNRRDYYMAPCRSIHRDQIESGLMVNRVLGIHTSIQEDGSIWEQRGQHQWW